MYFRRAPARLALRATGHADCASLLPVPLARQDLIKQTHIRRAEYGLSVWSAAMERITSSLSAASSR